MLREVSGLLGWLKDSQESDLLLQRWSRLVNIYTQARNNSAVYATKASKIDGHYHFTDVHGCIRPLLNNLLNIGYIRFATGDGQPSWCYYNIVDGQMVDGLPDEPNEHSRGYHDTEQLLTEWVLLPRVRLNEEFIGTITIGGDLVDKGIYSDECFWLINMLLEQQKQQLAHNQTTAKRHLYYLVGNHEALRFGRETSGYGYRDVQYYHSIFSEENTEFNVSKRSDVQVGIPVYESLNYHKGTPSSEMLHHIFGQRFRYMQLRIMQLIMARELRLSHVQDNGVCYTHSFWSVQDLQMLYEFVTNLPYSVGPLMGITGDIPVKYGLVNTDVAILEEIKRCSEGANFLPVDLRAYLDGLVNYYFASFTVYPDFLRLLSHPNDLTEVPGVLGVIWNRPKKYPQLDSMVTRVPMPQIIGHTIVTEPCGLVKNDAGVAGRGSLWYTDIGTAHTDAVLQQSKYVFYDASTQQYHLVTLQFDDHDRYISSEDYLMEDFRF